jgi:hypothetical protein
MRGRSPEGLEGGESGSGSKRLSRRGPPLAPPILLDSADSS